MFIRREQENSLKIKKPNLVLGKLVGLFPVKPIFSVSYLYNTWNIKRPTLYGKMPGFAGKGPLINLFQPFDGVETPNFHA